MIDGTEGMSSWMQTFTGRKFHFTRHTPEDIDQLDIAHALAQLCRYNGHTLRFYSVAEHCVLLSYAVSPENALHALLHDATEAYVGDVIRPLKRLLPMYRDMESLIWFSIATHFNISPEMPAEVLEADTRMLLNERIVLMRPSPEPWSIEHLSPVVLPDGYAPCGWAPGLAEQHYHARLKELLKNQST